MMPRTVAVASGIRLRLDAPFRASFSLISMKLPTALFKADSPIPVHELPDLALLPAPAHRASENEGVRGVNP